MNRSGGKNYGYHGRTLGAKLYLRICAGESYAEARAVRSIVYLLTAFGITVEGDAFPV